MKRQDGEGLQYAARRALALGHAALDSPTRTRVRDARRLVLRVLNAIDERLCGGELRELLHALRNMASALTGLELEGQTH